MLQPVSEACERNKDPILHILSSTLSASHTVLEIGSGTGQHAVYFAAHLPSLIWQPSDTGEFLPIVRERVRQEGGPNLRDAIELDVRRQPWPTAAVDAIFTANTLHIMSWSAVQDFFQGIGRVLLSPGVLCVYGPFRYGGRFTTDSNAAFDTFLRGRDPESGLRDFEAVDALARRWGLRLVADHQMPANNQLLVWQRPPRSNSRSGPAEPAVQ